MWKFAILMVILCSCVPAQRASALYTVRGVVRALCAIESRLPETEVPVTSGSDTPTSGVSNTSRKNANGS